jgi:hypothetical protein
MPYHGPEVPGDDAFEEHERISDEDVLKQIEDYLEPQPEIPDEDALVIRSFLEKLNVKDIDQATNQEIEILWSHLGKNPSLISDYSYILMDVKTGLTLSEFPVPLYLSELIDYSEEIGATSFSPRTWLVDNVVVPNLMKFQFREDQIKRNAYGELYGNARAGEATRYLGWLVGQRFMQGAEARFEDYAAEKDMHHPRVTHLAAFCSLEVLQALDNLQNRNKRYRKIPMEVNARQKYEDVVLAMKGIHNLNMHLFRGSKK